VPDFIDDFSLMAATIQNGTVNVPNYVNTNRPGTDAEFYISAGTPNFAEFNTSGYPVVQRVGEALNNGILRLKYGYTSIASVHLVLGDYRIAGQNYLELVHDNFTNGLRVNLYPAEATIAGINTPWADGYSMQLEIYGNYVVIKVLDVNDLELGWAEGYFSVPIGNSIFLSGSSASKRLYKLEKREAAATFTHKFWNLAATTSSFVPPTTLPNAITSRREVRWVKNPISISDIDGIDVVEGYFQTAGGTLRITHDDSVQLTINNNIVYEVLGFISMPASVGTIAAGTHSIKLVHTQVLNPNLCILEINEGAGWKIVEASLQAVVPPVEPPTILGDTAYSPWTDFAEPQTFPPPPEPRVQQPQDSSYYPWTDFAEPQDFPPLPEPRVQQPQDSSYYPWTDFAEPQDFPPLPEPRVQQPQDSSYYPWTDFAEFKPNETTVPPMLLEDIAIGVYLTTALDLDFGAYERYQTDILPPWLEDGMARLFTRASGALKDVLGEWLLTAALESVVGNASRDTLERKARDRSLFVVPLEPLEVLRARVANAFEVLDMAGTLPGLLTALSDAGWNARVIELYTEMPTDAWDETTLEVWDETTLEVWDGGEAQMFVVFVWQRIPSPLAVQQLPILINQFKSAESLLKALYQLPNNWDSTTPLPWYSSGTLIYGA
jgi:hypothetical protein